jgi:hypothetical protein
MRDPDRRQVGGGRRLRVLPRVLPLQAAFFNGTGMFPNADAKSRFRNAALPLKHDPVRADNSSFENVAGSTENPEATSLEPDCPRSKRKRP